MLKENFKFTWSCWPHCSRQVTTKLDSLMRFKRQGVVTNKQSHEDWADEVYDLFVVCHLCRTFEQGQAFIQKVMLPYLKKNGEDKFAQWAHDVYCSAEEYDWCAAGCFCVESHVR